MEGRGDGQHHGALGALLLRDHDGALDRRLVARDHHLGAAIVVGRIADLALSRLAGDLQGGVEFEPEQRRHGALPDRHGALHGIAANPQQPGRIGDGQAAGGGERRIFAERMAGDESRVPLEIEPGFRLSTRMAARLTAIRAGWVLAVSVSSSAGPPT